MGTNSTAGASAAAVAASVLVPQQSSTALQSVGLLLSEHELMQVTAAALQ